ncbi:MAG: NHLP leader peptide family RiPP precursor [Chroococcidiopsidaceae cyanobacterium CP_BM_RX_35]|nr:NHLP leader peptide family RiPP precursor [Chroococcidiopsidaceae cyanobacterium CP_BM_RX_35]
MSEQLQQEDREQLKPTGQKMGKCILRKDLEALLISKAWKDEAFKQALLSDNPKPAISEVIGTEILEGVEVEVLEESPSKVYLVLPMNPASVLSQVSDADLESVAVSMWT